MFCTLVPLFLYLKQLFLNKTKAIEKIFNYSKYKIYGVNISKS